MILLQKDKAHTIQNLYQNVLTDQQKEKEHLARSVPDVIYFFSREIFLVFEDQGLMIAGQVHVTLIVLF
jgi:hypothetical protein